MYLPLAILANKLTGGNYSYLVERPFLNGLPAWLYNSLAYVVTVAGFAAVTLLAFWICAPFQKKKAVLY